MERLMHKARPSIRITKLLQTSTYFFGIIRCKSLHNDAHRPDIIQSHMRASYPFTGFSFKEIRIIAAPYHFTGILINRIFKRTITQIRRSQQTGYIGIVHTKRVTKTVDLKGINTSTNRMIESTIPTDSCIHFICQCYTFSGEVLVSINFILYLSQLAQ